MIRVTITVPLDSIPGVTVETSYAHEYARPEVDMADTKLALVFQGEVESDVDFQEAHEWERTRPDQGIVKISKPRLEVERDR